MIRDRESPSQGAKEIMEMEMLQATETKRGRDLELGDVVICGGESRTITGFDSHPGLRESTARILCSGDYRITLFDDEFYRLTSGGAYIQSHLWWHHERR